MGRDQRSNKTAQQLEDLLKLVAEVDLRVKFLMRVVQVTTYTSAIAGPDGKRPSVTMNAEELFKLRREEFLDRLLEERDAIERALADAERKAADGTDAEVGAEAPAEAGPPQGPRLVR